MKLKITTAIILASATIIAQAPTGAPPTPYPATNAVQTQNVANFAWYRGGNTNGNGSNNNIFGTATGFNSSIWHQTNGFNRMVMWNGNGNQTDGKVGIGNNLDNSFIPQSRLHLRQMGYIL